MQIRHLSQRPTAPSIKHDTPVRRNTNCIDFPKLDINYKVSDIELHTWVFGNERNQVYQVLCKVLKQSCDRLGVPLIVHDIPPVDRTQKQYCFESNHYKLKFWNEFVSTITKPILIIDSDMVCINDPRKYMQLVENVGLTFKDNRINRFNGGCVFVQPTDVAKKIFSDWVKYDELLYNDKKIHDEYRSRYFGMNQSSMGYMIENFNVPITRLFMNHVNECENWECWKTASLVHLKGRLRRFLMGQTMPTDTINYHMVDIKQYWLGIKNEIV